MKRKILKTTLLTALPALTLASSCVMLTSCKNNNIWQGRDAYILDENNNKIWFTNLGDSHICMTYNNNENAQDDIISDNGTIYPRNTFNSTIYLNPTLKTIPAGFLWKCSTFDKVVYIPDSVTIINDHFLAECSLFNSQIGLSRSLTIIGGSFLDGCETFDKSIDLPITLKEIGTRFMHNNKSMKSTVKVHHIDPNVFSKTPDDSFTRDDQMPTNPIIIETFSESFSEKYRAYFLDKETAPYRYLEFKPAPTQK